MQGRSFSVPTFIVCFEYSLSVQHGVTEWDIFKTRVQHNLTSVNRVAKWDTSAGAGRKADSLAESDTPDHMPDSQTPKAESEPFLMIMCTKWRDPSRYA